ncbi:MAG: hypothetical protein KC731_25585, partial [Myxococcales bacterium]|nr:hypothetical protein [Myxococcales bacterium]
MNTRRRASALWSLALLAVLAGCSDDPSSTGGDGGAGATGTGGSGAAGGMMGTGGMGGMADDAYEQAIRAASWVEISGAPSVSGGAKNDDIFFFDDDHGFLASGNDHAIYETQDGGASWTTAFSATGAYFRAVTFTDAMTGFAGNIGAGLAPSINDPNPIYGTSDGGATWSPVTISGEAPAGICNFTSAPDGTLFGVGRANGPTHLATSSDGGATWSSVSLSSWLSMAIDARFT